MVSRSCHTFQGIDIAEDYHPLPAGCCVCKTFVELECESSALEQRARSCPPRIWHCHTDMSRQDRSTNNTAVDSDTSELCASDETNLALVPHSMRIEPFWEQPRIIQEIVKSCCARLDAFVTERLVGFETEFLNFFTEGLIWLERSYQDALVPTPIRSWSTQAHQYLGFGQGGLLPMDSSDGCTGLLCFSAHDIPMPSPPARLIVKVLSQDQAHRRNGSARRGLIYAAALAFKLPMKQVHRLLRHRRMKRGASQEAPILRRIAGFVESRSRSVLTTYSSDVSQLIPSSRQDASATPTQTRLGFLLLIFPASGLYWVTRDAIRQWSPSQVCQWMDTYPLLTSDNINSCLVAYDTGRERLGHWGRASLWHSQSQSWVPSTTATAADYEYFTVYPQ